MDKLVIGLAVYNSESYLEQTLDCILNQSFKNFKLLISDNYSTDRTLDIIKDYSHRDNRIKLYEHSSNIGGAGNFQRLLDYSEMNPSEYFMFARSEALFSNKYLEECIKVLEANKECVLAFASTIWIDDNDIEIDNIPVGFIDTRGQSPTMRAIFSLWARMHHVYGIMRYDALHAMKGKRRWQMIGADTAFLYELSFLGSFYHVDNEKWYRRYKYNDEPMKKRIERYNRNLLENPDFVDKYFPYLKLPITLIKITFGSDLKFKSKLSLFLLLIFNMPFRYIIAKKTPIH